jgi:hypothetical protein
MGRYYSGDIHGKFWFGVQSSDDASFFGGEIVEPNYINYYFSTDDLPTIKKGIKDCLAALGDNRGKLDHFFANLNGGYDYEMIAQHLGIEVTNDIKKLHPTSKVAELLTWYARLELGQKIGRCVKQNGHCSFIAER